jgi:hypothetical protein
MIRLPTFTFLNGPAGVGKTTLADLLTKQDVSMEWLSFATPLREALRAIFYYNDPHIDLRDPLIKTKPIPLCPPFWTHRKFMIDLADWLRQSTNDRLLGDIAKRAVERSLDYFSRFIFDDARTIGDVAPFIDGYGSENCLLILLERRGVTHLPGDVGSDSQLAKLPGIQRIVLSNNDEPEKMLDSLAILTSSIRPPKPRPTIADL